MAGEVGRHGRRARRGGSILFTCCGDHADAHRVSSPSSGGSRPEPASINRTFISLKRFFAWAVDAGLIARDPAKVVKLVEQVDPPPRFLSDREEDALIAAVSRHGTLRDRTLVVLLLHTGLRAHEICHLRVRQVHLGKRSGTLEMIGKRGKYREVPLNATARAALAEYLPTLPTSSVFLFPSTKTERRSPSGGFGYWSTLRCPGAPHRHQSA